MITRLVIVFLVALSVALTFWRPASAAGKMGILAVACVAGGYLLHRRRLRETNEFEREQQLNSTRGELDNWKQSFEQEQGAFHALMAEMDTAILICRPDATVQYANDAARRMFHFKSPNNRTFLALTLSYDLHNFLLGAVKNPVLHREEFTIYYPSESALVATVWPHVEEDGSANRFFVTLQDVTQLRKLEKIRRDFVANVSHELRTPLSSIRAMAETIVDDPELDEAMRDKWLNTIVKETERLTRIANDLLVLSRAESEPPQKATFDLALLLEEVSSRFRLRAKEAGLCLELDVVGPIPIDANYDQMQQVVLNLIDNAIKYTTEGEVRVTGKTEDGSAVVSVADTGIGILSDDLPRLFERFYRVDKARSKATGGTGLGLSIVKHIVESHGGEINVESEYRRGSVFSFRLPLGDPSAL